MKLQQLLQTYDFDDLMPVVADMFPGTGKYRTPLEEGYNILMSLQPVSSKRSIRYRIIQAPNGETSFIGAEDIAFDTTWEVCLGKEVVKEKGIELTDIELAANCLVNVCFIGRHPKSFDRAYQALQQK